MAAKPTLQNLANSIIFALAPYNKKALQWWVAFIIKKL
jgi:hypothetical protein